MTKSFILVALLLAGTSVLAQGLETSQIKTGIISKIAPGEFLPISVKLTNFGSKQRVDVSINYKIIDKNGKAVAEALETVAVETTASFIKQIQLPANLPAGQYGAEVRLIYEGQTAPAISRFSFTVEKKILGLFQSQFFRFGGVILLMSIFFGVSINFIMERKRLSRIGIHDYSNVSKSERLYYEIVSDIITQMRFRVGEKAMELAKNIDGLTIDENNGRVLSIAKSPAKIIALLILKYEKMLGQRISFALRKFNPEIKEHLATVDKNLIVIRKYFE